MKALISQRAVDTFGFWTSTVCALHCLVLPLFLSLGAFGSLAFLDRPYIEGSVISLSVLLGLCSMLPSYFKHHRKPSALIFLFIGFTLIGISRIPVFEVWEVILTSSGAAFVASAHFINYRLHKHLDSTK